MKDELTRLPDGRFITHNGEILPTVAESRRLFNKRQRLFLSSEFTLVDGFFDAIMLAFERSRVDEWGHWVSDLYVNPRNGYAHAWVKKPISRNLGLHVIAYTVFKESITGGNHIDHVCRYKLCWFPEHLDQKTPGANTRAGRDARRHRTQPPLSL